VFDPVLAKLLPQVVTGDELAPQVALQNLAVRHEQERRRIQQPPDESGAIPEPVEQMVPPKDRGDHDGAFGHRAPVDRAEPHTACRCPRSGVTPAGRRRLASGAAPGCGALRANRFLSCGDERGPAAFSRGLSRLPGERFPGRRPMRLPPQRARNRSRATP